LQSQEQQRSERQDNMDLVERGLTAAKKRSAGSGQQISYAQTNDDRHQGSDELEAAHEILCVLHDARPYRRLTREIEWQMSVAGYF
jgi:hypothetical protein